MKRETLVKITIIKEYQESLIGRHTGISRTYERLKSYRQTLKIT
jgi:hypothetical protein